MLTPDELFPCPFCGDEALISGEERYGYYVVCINRECYCVLGEGYDGYAMPDHCFRTEQDAVSAWNTRASK